MTAKHKINVSTQPVTPRSTAAERRQALNARLATQQADLKRDAQQRRERYASSHPAKMGTGRRRNSR